MGDMGTWVLRPRLWRKDGKLRLKNWIKQVMITGHGTQERDPMSLFTPRLWALVPRLVVFSPPNSASVVSVSPKSSVRP